MIPVFALEGGVRGKVAWLLWGECEADFGLLLYTFLEWGDGKYPAHLGSIASGNRKYFASP